MKPTSQFENEGKLLSRCWLSLACAVMVSWSVNDMGRAAETLVDSDAETAVAEQDLQTVIDAAWREKLAASNVSPAEVAGDEAFLRRIYLDVVGRVPTPEEREQFLKEPDRAALVDRLIHSEEYAIHFADLFDAVLMGRGGAKKYEERHSNQWRSYLERVFRENRPWDKVAEEILLARPTSDQDAGAVWYLFERNDNHQAIAEAIAPGFFGVRIDCAQCHDHMLATEIEQQYYWGLVAFFNRGKNVRTDKGPRIAESAVGGFSEFANIEGSSSPNRLTFLDAPVIDESRPGKDEKQEDADDLYEPSPIAGEPRIPKFSRREKFVSEVLRDNPLLAKAFVNRVWAILLGRGIVHPHDQIDSVHGPAMPRLLEELANDLRNHGYDIRRLVRGILLSQPYQLSAVKPPGVEDPATFAWYQQRPLTAEQFARSLQVAIRSEKVLQPSLVMQLRDKMPEVLPEHVVTGIGETLYLTNNPGLNDYILASKDEKHLIPATLYRYRGDTEGPIANEQLEQVIGDIYVALLGRLPDEQELDAVRQFLVGSATVEQSKRVEGRLYHLVWSLATSAEFRFNH